MKTYIELQHEYAELQKKFDEAREKKDVKEMLRLIPLMQEIDNDSKVLLLAKINKPFMMGVM